MPFLYQNLKTNKNYLHPLFMFGLKRDRMYGMLI